MGLYTILDYGDYYGSEFGIQIIIYYTPYFSAFVCFIFKPRSNPGISLEIMLKYYKVIIGYNL